MKPGTFALNPHAASYVPISKRVGDYGGDDCVMFAANYPKQGVKGQQISFSGVEVSVPKKTSSDMAYKQIRDDDVGDLDMEMDIDIDIEYLLVTFSGLSQESITDVYLANSCDLEATIEMLTQLEIYSNEDQEILPETLDIGDIAEAGPSTSKGSKQKKATEVAASSSSVITNAPVSA